MNRTWIGLTALLTIACGCAPTKPPTTGLASQPVAAAAMKEISFVRMRVGVTNDVIKVLIEADGSYQIIRRGGGGANSSTRGKLTEAQKRRFAAAFAGW